MNDTDLDKKAEEKSIGQATKDAMVEVGQTFVNLVKAPRALWGINISYFLEGLAYFGILTILGKYLSEDVGLSDLHAGWVYSLFTGGITLAMLVLGGVSDRIGVRKALLVSLVLMVCGRFFLAASGTFFQYGQGPGSAMFWSVLLGLFIIVVGYGMYQPAAYAGVKAYTNKKTAAIGFAMIYALMNLGAFFSGIFSPPIRQSYRMVGVYWFYVIITAMAFLSVAFILTKKTVRNALERIAKEDEADADDQEEQKEKEPENKAEEQAKAKRSMFEPLLVAFSVIVVGAAAALIVLKISAPIHPLEQASKKTNDALSVWSSSLQDTMPRLPQGVLDQWMPPGFIMRRWIIEAESSKTAQLVSRNSEFKERLKKLKDEFSPDRIKLPEGGPVSIDPMPLTLMKAVLGTYLQTPTEGLDLNADRQLFMLSASESKTYRQKLRAHAVRTMAVAYALLSPVDDKVIEEIRLRLKRIDEEIVPLDDKQLKGIQALVKMPAKQMLLALEEADQKLSGQVGTLAERYPGMNELAYDLSFDAKILKQMLSTWRDAPTKLGTKALTHKLLFDALAYKDEADAMVQVHEKDVEPKALNGATLAAIWTKHDADLFKQAADFLPAAVKAPSSNVMSYWMTRYGILIGIGLIALILLVIRMLKLRPDHPFHNSRFTFFIFILIPVQTLFAHNWLTLPYYINRAFGGTSVGENFEFFSNINPILIFFLTPLVAALTSRAKVYPMMIWGTLVMAIPTFLLALPPSPAMLITYILLMSVGEAMWQPRFLQLIAEIAPEGQTGAYMGIGQLPWFLTKVVTGIYSGWFLAQYCPLIGPQNTQVMWLIYGLIAVASPIGLWMAKGWVGSRIEEKH